MADSKQGESFFRKVVRFVANPTTDWTEINSRQDDNRELELEKSELKAMIERKRRNDFVRKREFDMLRKVRREGLSPEQLAALGGSSKLDDSESRANDSHIPRGDSGVKAKIDEIEQQMVGGGNSQFSPTSRRQPLQTEPPARPPARPPLPPIPADERDEPGGGVVDDDEALPPLPPLPDFEPGAPSPARAKVAAGLPPLAPASSRQAIDPDAVMPPVHRPAVPSPQAVQAPAAAKASGSPADRASVPTLGVEVSEVVHDPDLDETVIAFANADFTAAESALQQLTGNGAPRAFHAETWLVLFDLYRATGQQLRFESLALDYAQQFGSSAPQWFSLPQLVADAVAEERPRTAPARAGTDIHWRCPEQLDTDSVTRLRAQTLQTPLPWIFDWSDLQLIDAEAAMQLSTLFRVWSAQTLDMRWVGGERLFDVLKESAPTGVRDADPVYWLTRLDGLRLANRADQFDEAAIDYCVTYEVSPPSWERARCNVQITETNLTSRLPMGAASEMSTSFLESRLTDDGEGGGEVATVELSGQLVGDISATLSELGGQLGTAPIVSVSCARLIRVDFVAAGDLLNWVLSTTAKGRMVQFVDTHRLVALFFGAMGITEHARVQVHRV